jgi:ligand-binding SRPBCC domain-containing protein
MMMLIHTLRREHVLDVQVRGPYRLWHHTHEVEALGEQRSRMRDTVHYAIGFGPLGAAAHRLVVRRDLEAIFDYRAATVPALIARMR